LKFTVSTVFWMSSSYASLYIVEGGSKRLKNDYKWLKVEILIKMMIKMCENEQKVSDKLENG
jgi:hypothetical protein